MTRSGAAFILVLIGAVPAFAAELPSRKPGLWEIKIGFENRNAAGPTMRQCIDAATDQAMQSNAGPIAQATCAKRDVQRTATGITIDSTCTVAGKTANSHAVVTGSFDSAYTMTVTSQGEGLPGGGTTMTVSAQWLGPCAADQKPGDMIMANGLKMNIIEMQRRGGLPGAPGIPGTPGAPGAPNAPLPPR
jgi:hypothetical protein